MRVYVADNGPLEHELRSAGFDAVGCGVADREGRPLQFLHDIRTVATSVLGGIKSCDAVVLSVNGCGAEAAIAAALDIPIYVLGARHVIGDSVFYTLGTRVHDAASLIDVLRRQGEPWEVFGHDLGNGKAVVTFARGRETRDVRMNAYDAGVRFPIHSQHRELPEQD